MSEEGEYVITARGAVREIAFGSIAGMVSEVVEYPFDLAKVRLQAQLLAPSSSTTLKFKGPMDCLMQTWKEEGVKGLYRGLPAPVVGSMAETAALFVAYSAFQNVIRTFSPPPVSSSNTRGPAPLSIPQIGLAAAGAGFVASFVLTPIELVKCKMQVQMMNFHPTPANAAAGRIPHRPFPIPSSVFSSSSPSASTSGKQLHTTAPQRTHSLRTETHTNTPAHTSARASMHDIAYPKSNVALPSSIPASAARPPGIIALVRSIVDSYGVRGLWLGHTGTLLRETGGSAAWFVTKEWVARKLVERRVQAARSSNPSSQPSTALLTWESALSGALAGAVGALVFYPADTVKSAIQTEEELRPRGRKIAAGGKSTFVGTFRKMYVRHGVRGLYAGCGMTVARAVPSSGIIFVVYDGLSAWFA
ncbi:mitochondrial carrier domain-containing protein [Crassisporium funariophilum]|nr:mitochondrial carrier domain-containing protein [Crassisporium funariophilum]